MLDVGVEKTPNRGGDVRAVWGRAEFDGQLRVGGTLGIHGGSAAGVAEKQFRDLESAERVGQGKALVEEKRDRKDAGTLVGLNPGQGVAIGGLQNQAGDMGVFRAKFDRQRRPEARAVDQESGRGNVLQVFQIPQG